MLVQLRPAASLTQMLDLAFSLGSLWLVFRLYRMRSMVRRGQLPEVSALAERVVAAKRRVRPPTARELRLATAELLARLGAGAYAARCILTEAQAMASEGWTTRAELLVRDLLELEPSHPEARKLQAELAS